MKTFNDDPRTAAAIRLLEEVAAQLCENCESDYATIRLELRSHKGKVETEWGAYVQHFTWEHEPTADELLSKYGGVKECRLRRARDLRAEADKLEADNLKEAQTAIPAIPV